MSTCFQSAPLAACPSSRVSWLTGAEIIAEDRRDSRLSFRRYFLQPVTAYPKSWDDVAIGCVVLAKDDGPWCSWWEAIPTDQSGDTFSLQWRKVSDMPKIAQPNVARHRLSLGLLYPNKH